MFDYVKSLEFEQTPDYSYLIAMLNKALLDNGLVNDSVFEWSS
jgi:phage-related protein